MKDIASIFPCGNEKIQENRNLRPSYECVFAEPVIGDRCDRWSLPFFFGAGIALIPIAASKQKSLK